MHRYRTHTCGELRKEHSGRQVRLSGWIHSVRDHGGIIFIDLRDHYGLTQIVVDPQREFYKSVEDWRVETVVCFTGNVVERTADTVNPRLATGEIEVAADDMEVLGEADVLPFLIAKDDNAPEAIRLQYRFLDLRRDRLHKNILLRSQVIASIRRRMTALNFNEYQTPILTSSSPEGARDFLVPSRLHPGKFYALPQAPQQFKQLLMVAGFDRYFQIAPCFRDEDARADRSPGEFYQLDLEMSFVTQEDVFAVVEDVLTGLFQEFSAKKITTPPYPRIPYREAMKRYGTDKPDLRNPLQMIDVTDIFRDTQFKAFGGVVKQGGIVRAIVVKEIANQSRKFFDDMVAFGQSVGAKGLGYIVWSDGKEKSPIVKFLSRSELDALSAKGGIEDGDVMFFLADREDLVCDIGGKVRTELGKTLGLIDENVFHLCWIVDFPMYEKNETTGKIEFSHNPFSMPQGGLEALLTKDPLDVLAYQYDIVCNGIELSSGAIRNHEPEIMYKAFEIAGYAKEHVDEKFGGMMRAFKLGAPPHGGIAPGIDRIVMLLAGESNLREIIAFPFNQQAQDLMMNAPSEVTPLQLKELHLILEKSKL
ncbi:MAG: aspartate--tRNA ligase [Deltaproteobacteria bacterium]|nr:aspartate--tRNA ligase [Deltaproteobacteria bacterium]